MKTLIAIAFSLVLISPSIAQETWIVLEEYPSPGEGARGVYYDGKVLWNVDNESQTVFTLNPYNLEVVDIYPSPVSCPWGITVCDNRMWMTNFGWDSSQLVCLNSDTFQVAQTWNFPNWYFYGLTADSTIQHLWISAMNHSYNYYLMEFDVQTTSVIAWHPWSGNWPLGLQYWDHQLWINSSTWTYPDFTFVLNLDPWNIEEMLICPLEVPEGIATNGVVWWISHFRNNAPYIWKLLPPGWELHDIAWFSPHDPPASGPIQELVLTPQAEFINYGQFAESNVPFICRIKEFLSNEEIYYDSVVHPLIDPEETVTLGFSPVLLLPNTEYEVTFYSNLATDDYRANDTLRMDIMTPEGGIHDLAIVAIIEPDENELLEQIHPSIVIQNTGNYFEPTAPVHLEIRHPSGQTSEYDTSGTQLTQGEIDTLTFLAFMPPDSGMYVFVFNGLLPEDAIPINDSVGVNCMVGRVHDVAPVEIISPGEIEPLGNITPIVVVENLGGYNEDFFYVNCTIEDSTGLLYEEHVMCPQLAPGDLVQREFPDFIPPGPNIYTCTFETQLGTDNIPENDIISREVDVTLALNSNQPTYFGDFNVKGSYPNPFNTETCFLLQLPQKEKVILSLYNTKGQEMVKVSYGNLPPGEHLLPLGDMDLASGLYLAGINAGEWHKTVKIVLLK
jgi:hypothetical protein